MGILGVIIKNLGLTYTKIVALQRKRTAQKVKNGLKSPDPLHDRTLPGSSLGGSLEQTEKDHELTRFSVEVQIILLQGALSHKKLIKL